MIKKALIELVQDRVLAGGVVSDQIRKVHDGTVEYLIDAAVSDLVKNSKSTKQDVSRFAQRGYSMSVLSDGDGASYVDLDPKPIGGASGITIIKPKRTAKRAYTKLDNLVHGGMVCDIVEEEFGSYYIENQRVYFMDEMEVSSVFVSMVPSFSELDDTDEIGLPGVEFEIINMLIQLFKQTDDRVVDLINDSDSTDTKIQQQ